MWQYRFLERPMHDRGFRFRITFAKTDEMRFTGHLDLQRTWERLFRRAELPLRFTRGFHPHPRFNLAAALPLGFTGAAEILDLYLDEKRDPDALAASLREVSPPGIRIVRVDPVDAGAQAVQTLVAAAEYTVELAAGADRLQVARRLDALLGTECLPRERRGKTYDLRPLIDAIEIDPEPAAEARLAMRMRLAAREGMTGRPDEVLLALGIDPLAARIRRDRILLAGG